MITGLGHVAYAVDDLDAALEFYVQYLGLTEAFRLYREDGTPWIVYLHVGARGFVELFPGGRGGDGANASPSYRHLCLEVDNMAATLADMAERGMTIEGEPNRGQDGNLQYWVTDPDGNRIELHCYTPESKQNGWLA